MRLYLDVEGAGIHAPSNWSVELCGNDTQNGSDSGEFYSSSSRAILELHTGHRLRHRHHHHHQQPQLSQQQQHRQRRRPRFRGFRGTFRFLSKGRLHYISTSQGHMQGGEVMGMSKHPHPQLRSSAKLCSIYCKTCTSEYSHDCYQWLSNSSRVHQIRFRTPLGELTALP